MRKTISLMLLLAMLISVFALGGCSATEDEALTVSVVVSSAFGDNSYNDAVKEGADRLLTDYNVKINTLECKHQDNYKQKLTEAAKISDIVVCVGWHFYEITEVSKEFTNTKFIWVDNTVDGIENYPNLLCITYAQNEGSFLAGYVAGKMSKTGTIGAVAGEDSPTVNDFLAGYEQGAKYANPQIKFVKAYIESYEDVEKAKKSALELYDQKADIIFHVAGSAGKGVFQAAEEKSFYAIGVDQDQKVSMAEFDEQIICSMRKDIGSSVYDTVKLLIEKEIWNGGRNWRTDLANGYVDVTYGEANSVQLVSEEIKKEEELLTAKIVAGEITVNSAIGQ